MTLPKRVEHRQPRVRRDLASALRSAAAGIGIPDGRRGGRGARRDGAIIDPELVSLRDADASSSRARRARPRGQVRVGRALSAHRTRQRAAAEEGGCGHQLVGPHLRPDRRVAHRTRVHPAAPDGDPRVTDDGRLLARIYSESDLLVAECLRTGVWTGLEPAELAAVVSAVVYETRGGDGPGGAACGGADRAVAAGAARRRGGCPAQLRADETAAPDRAQARTRRRFRHAPSTAGRRTGDLAAALAAAESAGQRFAVVGGGFRAVVPAGARPAGPGPQRRPEPGAAGNRETRASTTFGAASSQLMPGRLRQELRLMRTTDARPATD